MPTKTVRNVLGEPLATCSLNPLAGFLRDGVCRMPTGDAGRHGVCARMTEAFLAFTKQQGNDLSTPQPLYGFPGLKPGERWCPCVDRWKEAEASGVAPPVILAATHASAGKHIPIERLKNVRWRRKIPDETRCLFRTSAGPDRATITNTGDEYLKIRQCFVPFVKMFVD